MSVKIKKNYNQKSASTSSAKQADLMPELRQLLKENIALTKELEEQVQKISRWITWQRVYFWVKLVVIVIPVALGIIYLPPLFAQYFHQIKTLINTLISSYGF
ncbi:MAG: hypothetical protein Q8Q23_01580 [bacterium]|nr:hypothetical protein [bacterium]